MTKVSDDKIKKSLEEIETENCKKNAPFLEFLYYGLTGEYKTPKGPVPAEKPKPKAKKPSSGDFRKILEPLDGVFFEPALKDDLIVRVSIPQLIAGQMPTYPGVILFGPPGTGKSEFQRAVIDVYGNVGAYAKQVSSSEMNSMWVSQLAKNLESELQMAQSESQKRSLPYFLSFDEGSIFAEKSDNGASNVSRHYQEAIDVLKRYLGNKEGNGLEVSISTNPLPEDFEEAMTREGRLRSFFIGYPAPEQVAQMWQHFTKLHNVLDLKDEDATNLAREYSGCYGAFIEQFCRGYEGLRRSAVLKSKGYSTLFDALKNGANVSEEEVRKTINPKIFFEDLRDYVTSKIASVPKEETAKIGFKRE